MFRVERHGMSGSRTGSSLTVMRERRMWTQLRLAEEAGVSPTTVSGIENGRISRPHFGTLRKLARALGVQPEELISVRSFVEDTVRPPLSLEWAMASGEEEFERGLEDASLESLEHLSKKLEEECQRLQKLYGEFPRGSEQSRLIKRQIREVAGHSGSVETSAMFHRSRKGG
jgi:transcriptional regulator with XRE-family HTH domain